MKLTGNGIAFSVSRPAWGAWIETVYLFKCIHQPDGRAPHGARGLKLYLLSLGLDSLPSRAPHGARGLKPYLPNIIRIIKEQVAPRMGRVD